MLTRPLPFRSSSPIHYAGKVQHTATDDATQILLMLPPQRVMLDRTDPGTWDPNHGLALVPSRGGGTAGAFGVPQ